MRIASLLLCALSCSQPITVMTIPNPVFPINPNQGPEKYFKAVYRIINGNEAAPNSKPYVVFLKVSRGRKLYRCGGSIIDSNNILTAAHCVDGATKVVVNAGRHDVDLDEENVQTVISLNYTVHEGFRNEPIRSRDDVALIHLPHRLNFTSSTQVLQYGRVVSRVLLARTEPIPGSWVEAIGWGYKSPGKFSSTLLTTTNKVLDDDGGLVRRKLQGLAKDKYICIDTSTGQLPCSGDSGGPLMNTEGKVTGISSFARKGCVSTSPACFASVPYYSEWIASNMKDLTQC